MIAIMKNIANTKATPPHRGIVTYHHDQSMQCVNFNIMNIRNNNIPNPIPPDCVDLFPIFILLNYSCFV